MKYQKNGEILTAIVSIDGINKRFFASKIQSNKKNDCSGCFARPGKYSREFCVALFNSLSKAGFPDCNRGWAYKSNETITKTIKKQHSKYKKGYCQYKNGKHCNIPSGMHCADRLRLQWPDSGNECGVGK